MARRSSKSGANLFRSARHQLAEALLTKVVGVVVNFLSDERVIRFLERATDETVKWARERLTWSRRLRSRFADLFGQRALERRISKLAQVVETVFTTAPPDLLASMRSTVSEIRQALDVARAVSFLKRRRMHSAINDSINEFEKLLASAVLKSTGN